MGPRRILVVDDDQDIRETLLDVLTDAGYSVLLAANGAEALAILEGDETPSLILLDLMMPGMEPLAFRAAQMANPRTASIPLVVVSATGNVRETAELIGAAGYVEKPMKLDDILGEIELRCGPDCAAAAALHT